MTEKTPKTPRSDQDLGPSKNQADVSNVTKPGSAASSSQTTAADKASATTSGTTAPAAKSDAEVTQKSSEPKSAVVAAGSPQKADTGTKSSATDASAKGSAKTKPASQTSASTTRPDATRPDSAAKPAGSGGGSSGTTPPPMSSEPARKKSSSLVLVVIAIVVVLLAAGMWYQHTTSQDAIQRLESQARSSADQARSAEQKAQQALDSLKQQQGVLTALRSELQESKAELKGLGTAFQTITDRGSDLVLLSDIDHLVMIAQQQLQLNGNVANAIISLETAQAQLARANRPALASLQQTINGDLDRLRAATTVDIALLSGRLDELAGLVGQAPLLVPDDAVPELDKAPNGSASNNEPSSEPAAQVEGEWWEKALTRTQQWTAQTFETLRHDLGQLVSVRRVDDATALLISPDQATRFRDSLRQRIMTAQLALMMDQSLIWETETDSLLKAVQSRFDPQSAVTRQAIRIAREVADTAIDSPLPDVTNTIKALEALNEQMGRGSMPVQSATEAERGTAGPEQMTNKAPEAESAQSADNSAQSTEAEANDDATSDDGAAAQGADNTDDDSGAVDTADDATSEQINQNTGNTGLKL